MLGIRRMNQRGDTIVEVLLAILIISFILVGAYVVVNTSTNYDIQSQLRGEATELGQSQLEQLRYNVNNNTTILSGLTGSSGFCYQSGNLVNGPGNCYFNSLGVPVMASNKPNFQIYMTACISSSNPPPNCAASAAGTIIPYYITLQENWTQTVGGNISLKIPYRIYQ